MSTTAARHAASAQHGGRAAPRPFAVVLEMVRWDVREKVRLAAGVGVALAVTSVMVLALYPAVGDGFADLQENLPESVRNLLGGASASTLPGWVNLELVSILLPFVLLLLGAALGAAWLAGAEDDRTAAVLLSTPATRGGVVLAACVAGVLLLAVATVVTLAGFVVGDAVVPDDLGRSEVVATLVHVATLGVLGLALALAVGALGGRRALALGVPGVVGVVSFVVDGFAPTVPGLEWAQNLSAFFWAVGHEPLTTGWDLAGLGVVLGASVLLVLVAVVAYERRDLRV